MRHRQSILLTSFAPMKPIVVTKEMETQTDESEPLKTFGTIETQTESVQTISTRMQTENASTKESTMQTQTINTDSIKTQTEKPEAVEQEVQVNTFAVEMSETQCQTSDVLMQSSEDHSDYTSSDQQRSAHLRPKGMQISVGDEGGTAQGPRILAPQGAQTTKAGAQRPSFSFKDAEFSEEQLERITDEDRSRVKKELSQSMTAAEAKKQRSAAIKKKIQDEYVKNRDPIKEFFTLVSIIWLLLTAEF